MQIVYIKDEFIKLGQALKLAGLVDSGVEAKYEIEEGKAIVNGEVDTRRGRKLYPEDKVDFKGQQLIIRQKKILSVDSGKLDGGQKTK